MRIFLILLSLLGTLVVTLGTVVSFQLSIVQDPQSEAGVGYFFAMCLGFLGIFLALVGGLIARPKYLWIPLFVVGLVYIISFYGIFLPSPHNYPNGFRFIVIAGRSLGLIPGLICIGEGIFIYRNNRRNT